MLRSLCPSPLLRCLALLWLALWSAAAPVLADQSAPFTSPALEARLITVETGVAPGTQYLSAGLQVQLAEGWKTYWRAPGEVGLPPRIDWSGSVNLAGADLLFPAPHRFRAFGIENFGYAGEVTFPLRLTLADPGQPVHLQADVALLVCAEVCIPADLSLSLDLPAGAQAGIDQMSAATIATWSARVPMDPGNAEAEVQSAHIDPAALTVTLHRADGWSTPDIFPEFGEYTAFGAPDIRLSEDATLLWARLPVLTRDDTPAPLWLTATDGDFAVTFEGVPLAGVAAVPPYEAAGPARNWGALAGMIGLAFLGGLILNAMPCVLPVLSIKLTSAMMHSDRSPAQVRTGFVMTALGTLAFMWALAAVVLVMQALGHSVGWGLQFQNPYFLIVLLFVLGLFAANMFGLFEIALPAGAMTRLARAGGHGYLGDLATGAFAAVLATPCSAPLLGTALAFALSGSPLDVVLIFSAMGLGLALPYLAIAARPSLIGALPRPGPWMVALKAVLGLLLLVTALWLLWVLAALTSQALAGIVALLVLGGVAAVWQSARLATAISIAAVALSFLAALSLPAALVPDARTATNGGAINWVPFERAEIARLVSTGDVVFVDITADWCLTCKANKALVIDRAPVTEALSALGITPMRGDWTRPDPAIQAFLEGHGRYGIPFNMVFGPGAPEGIALPEVLTTAAVLEALQAALGQQTARAE